MQMETAPTRRDRIIALARLDTRGMEFHVPVRVITILKKYYNIAWNLEHSTHSTFVVI